MAALNPFASSKRIVLKIGSALLVDQASGTLNQDWLTALCADIAAIDAEVILVSSGAIALGRARFSLDAGRLTLAQKQACAAAGQSLLTQAYEHGLGKHGIITAQALLTLNDTENRRRWLNARSTLETLIGLGAIPIINENDTVATDEIRYGDNDRLAARTAQMLGADTLILLSDIDGLYETDPRLDKSAKHIPIIDSLTPEIMAMGGEPNMAAGVGTGGMVTKLAAAKIAIDAGCHMGIMNGEALSPLTRLMNGEKASWFKAAANPQQARRQWIGGSIKPKGCLMIDAGAAKALTEGKSLLAAGITGVTGNFKKGDAVIVTDQDGLELARGLASYSADDAVKILGRKSGDIVSILGYDNGAAIIHRDNMGVTNK